MPTRAMATIQVNGHTEADGTLDISVSTGLPESGVGVSLNVDGPGPRWRHALYEPHHISYCPPSSDGLQSAKRPPS